MEAQVEKIASLTDTSALKVEEDESSRRPSLIEQANKVTEARGLSRQHFCQQFVFKWAFRISKWVFYVLICSCAIVRGSLQPSEQVFKTNLWV